ncbi:MAG: hypothetical protein ACPLSK_03800, partial [bacterium]
MRLTKLVVLLFICAVPWLFAQQSVEVLPGNKVSLELRDVPRLTAIETLLKATGKGLVVDSSARRFNDLVSLSLQNVDF